MSQNNATIKEFISKQRENQYEIKNKKDYMQFIKRMHDIKKAKAYFLQTGEILPIVRKPVVELWQKCIDSGMNLEMPFPQKRLSPDELNLLLAENKFIIEESSAVIEAICSIIKNANFNIMLIDKTGHILYIKEIQNNDNKEITLPKLDVGCCFYEKGFFTGTVSMALELKKNFSLYGPEHFISSYENLSCDSVLLYDSNGQITGVITVTYFIKSSINTLLPGIASTVAELIEQRLINDRNLRIIEHTFSNISDGAIVVDSGLNIVRANNRFLNLIKENENVLSKLDVKKLFDDVDFHGLIRESKSKTTISEIIMSYNTSFYKLNLHISAIYSGCCFDGFVILLREIKDITNLSYESEKKSMFRFCDIITQDKSMKDLIKDCETISYKDINVLLQGESGTGKELFAQSIHSLSTRSNKPFIAINCAALPSNLVESELFGYEKGAFSGALSSGHAGKFEQADGGTVFLDEIGELPIDIQAKLLRVLDNNRITRIGGNREKSLDVRIIAATNLDLYSEVKKKKFREDLYYRISVINFFIPPLRNRLGDIDLLIQYFLDKLNKENEKGLTKKISQEALNLLHSYNWNGNVRELKNTVISAYHLCNSNFITSVNIPPYIVCESQESGYYHKDVISESQYSAKNVERNLIVDVLNSCNGNIKKASIQLDIPLSTLYKKIKRFKIMNENKSFG